MKTLAGSPSSIGRVGTHIHPHPLHSLSMPTHTPSLTQFLPPCVHLHSLPMPNHTPQVPELGVLSPLSWAVGCHLMNTHPSLDSLLCFHLCLHLPRGRLCTLTSSFHPHRTVDVQQPRHTYASVNMRSKPLNSKRQRY